MINSIKTPTTPGMNISNHNTSRKRGVQERSDWFFIIPRTAYFTGVRIDSMGGLLCKSATIVGVNFLPVPCEGSDGPSLTPPVSGYSGDISLHTLRIRYKMMPSARGKGTRYRP